MVPTGAFRVWKGEGGSSLGSRKLRKWFIENFTIYKKVHFLLYPCLWVELNNLVDNKDFQLSSLNFIKHKFVCSFF